MTGSVTQRRGEILRLLQESSPRTVSALAGELGVSAVTVRRDVDALAEEGRLRRRHGAVSALTVGRPSRGAGDGRLTFGMIVPTAEYYFADIIRGARAAAATAGVRLLLGVSDYEPALERQLADRLLVGGADGLLFAPTPDFETGALGPETTSWLLKCPISVVLVDRTPADALLAAVVDSVGAAQGAGAAIAVQHLAELGHRTIALVCKPGPNARPLIEGYRSAAAELGVDSIAEIMANNADEALTTQLLALRARGMTAVFVQNEQIAMGLLARLEAAGVAVPEDLSVICSDDVAAGLAHPPLTAVAPRKAEIGERAVALLVRAASGGAEGREHISLPPGLRIRSSVWPVPASEA